MNLKSPATIEEQLKKLESRGCLIENRDKAASTLTYINYYRLAHYFEPFLQDKYHYKPGTTFEEVVSVYDFDRRLRQLILSVLEEVEIALRAVVSNFHAMRYSSIGYLDASTFNQGHNHIAFLSKLERIIESNSDKAFVKHHNKKYKGNFPLWVLMEMFSFGNLVYFFVDMKNTDKKELANKYFDSSPSKVESWLACANELRNHCAHYNRLYANYLGETPKLDEAWAPYEVDNRLFSHLLSLKKIFLNSEKWNSHLIIPLETLLNEFGELIDISLLGFPFNWLDKLSNL